MKWFPVLGMLYPVAAIQLSAVKAKGRSGLFFALDCKKNAVAIAILIVTVRCGILAQSGPDKFLSSVGDAVAHVHRSGMWNSLDWLNQLKHQAATFEAMMETMDESWSAQLNLGLRKHILKCGQLTKRFGSIILFEGELVVSPVFYQYAQQCSLHFRDDDRIAGISLYNHCESFVASLPFEPLDDGFDNCFLQSASSWGQAWTWSQWELFQNWYDRGHDLDASDLLPASVRKWPEGSVAIYDAFFEIMPTQLKSIAPALLAH